jgi:integrase
VSGALVYLGDDLPVRLALEDLVRAAHLSPAHFSTVFRRATGLPPLRYVQGVRLERAKELLAEGELSVVEVARAGGFRDAAYFHRTFKRDGARAEPAIEGDIHPHQCRHTFASHLLAARRPLTEISYVLGHSSRAVTMDIYGHFLPSERQGTPAALARSYPAPAASTARPQADRAT